MNTVAVTGASGLLGRHLVDKLTSQGTSVIAVVRDPSVSFAESVIVRQADVLDPLTILAAFDGATAVIHAAGYVSFNPRRREMIMDVNVTGTRNIVNACLQSGINNLIHISSVSALGRKDGESVTEQHPWTGQYASTYATSKYLAELEVFRGAEEGLTVGIVNPSVILSGTPGRSSASLLDYVWKENRFYTVGTLNYVDARDVCDAVFELLARPRPGERFILSGGEIPFLEFFSKVARHWGRRAPSIRITSTLVSLLGLVEEIRSFLLQREPLVTRQSASMTVRSFSYDTTKVRAELGIRFRSIDESTSWCCSEYQQNVSRKK